MMLTLHLYSFKPLGRDRKNVQFFFLHQGRRRGGGLKIGIYIQKYFIADILLLFSRL